MTSFPLFTALFPVLVVVLSVVALYVDRHITYYPIQVSRMAAGRRGYAVLVVAAVVMVCAHIAMRRVTPAFVGALGGVALLTLVDDATSWPLHMAGVAVMIVATAAHVAHTPAAMLVLGVGWALPSFVQCAALVIWELGDGDTVRLHDAAWLRAKHTRRMELMFTGAFRSARTRHAYRVAGVCQWVVLWFMCAIWDDLAP